MGQGQQVMIRTERSFIRRRQAKRLVIAGLGYLLISVTGYSQQLQAPALPTALPSALPSAPQTPSTSTATDDDNSNSEKNSNTSMSSKPGDALTSSQIIEILQTR